MKFLIFFLIPLFLASKLPEIEPKDAVSILKQIKEAHVFNKTLTPILIKRSIEGLLEELDPVKTYLLQEEADTFLTLNDESLTSIAEAVDKGDFSFYETIHAKMITAISRRKRIEKEIEKEPPCQEKVSFKEFEDPPYVKTESELKERLKRIACLQLKAVKKLEEPLQEKALQRIAKRRNLREEEIAASSNLEKKRFILVETLKAIASAFDTHTAYFTPNEASQFLIQVQQRLFGIGAQLRDDVTGFTIVKIIEGGPAFKNGKLKVNDRIIAINKEPVVGMEITDAVELIRGEEGTKVLLTVLREKEIQEGQESQQYIEEEERVDCEITRGEVVIHESRITSQIIPFGDSVIAHISLFAFYQDPSSASASDLYDEIMKIKKKEKLAGIILDLRHNTGGILPQAVAVTSLFINKGIVVSVKDNEGHVEHLRNIDEKIAWAGPLIVLTSKASASASEIVAQTLQDYGRAIIVGDEHTFGKGSFQTFTLDPEKGKINPKGEFKVTRGTYYTVSGKSPQFVGVKPDIVVSGLFSQAEIGERYTKFPLTNDNIAPNFEDDLSDIPSPQKEKMEYFYRFNLQPKITTYTEHLSQLIKNSENRLKEDPFYTHFQKEVAKDEDGVDLALFAEADLQLKETINIMKDLILLLE